MLKITSVENPTFIDDIGNTIEDYLKCHNISKIDNVNKPFENKILPEEIGLGDLKVNAPVFVHNEKVYQTFLRKIAFEREFKLTKKFKSLTKKEKKIVIKELTFLLEKDFTHIFTIYEKRNCFIESSYVLNKIIYVCSGVKIIN